MQIDKVGTSVQPLNQHDFIKHSTSSGKRPLNNNQETVVNKEKAETVARQLNDFMEPLRTNLQFKFHEELNEYYVEVVNPLTNEVIKEIPPKKMLDMYAAMAGFMGILIDRKI